MPKSSSRSSKNSGIITLVFLAGIIILGIYYAATGNDPFGMFPTETPTRSVTISPATKTPIPPEPTAVPETDLTNVYRGAGPGWEVFFADPINVTNPNDYADSIEQRLIERIEAARTSIHIVSFEFDLTPVAEALVAAHERGVDVRWVTDDEHGREADEEPGHGQFAMLEESGIEVRDDSRTALMHNKFWIFDNRIVWTGSTNITVNGIFKQNNNTLVLESPELAAIYEREFQEMWDGKFGPKSPSTFGQQTAIVNGMQVEALFASEDPVINRIYEVVGAAQESIRFMAFSFTDYPLAKTMIDRAAVGVDVAGVFEKVGSETEFAELATLICEGIPARQDGNPSFLHHKLIIVDERIVITGSLNFSSSASEANDENVIIVENPDIARYYLAEFERVWSQASDPDPAKLRPCR
jgi:phosphatidylserine/phosphatidylglycerophosphate/cardiolipin synthase-like enzyme